MTLTASETVNTTVTVLNFLGFGIYFGLFIKASCIFVSFLGELNNNQTVNQTKKI